MNAPSARGYRAQRRIAQSTEYKDAERRQLDALRHLAAMLAAERPDGNGAMASRLMVYRRQAAAILNAWGDPDKQASAWSIGGPA